MLPGGVFLRLAFVAVTVLASINGPCTIGEQAGTCVATADCTAKGGSFQDTANVLRSAVRSVSLSPDTRTPNIGFRCARTLRP